jgi:hypothetical protein
MEIFYSYIIKINDDYKIIHSCDINNDNIILILKNLYPFYEIIICNLYNNPILKYLDNKYGFLSNKTFELNTFCENINYFNTFMNNNSEIFSICYTLDNIEQSIIYEKDIYIYYNNYFNNIIITNLVKPEVFNEFTLIYNGLCDKEQIDELISLQDNIFINIEIAKYNINKIINKYVINTKISIFELKELIHKYFYLCDNQENKIKFTDIWQIILLKQDIDETYKQYVKKQLPKALEEIGLCKKRLTNGIYWYGLAQKNC